MKVVPFSKKLIIIGFGSVGQAVIPLLLTHLNLKKEQILILSKAESGKKVADAYGLTFKQTILSIENYQQILKPLLQPGDFLLNLSVDVSSIALLEFCQKKQVLYLDTCIEPWAGGYTDTEIPSEFRSNYALRETMLRVKKDAVNGTSALVTHGANPGLVSHFVKQALINMANDNELVYQSPSNKLEWAKLAYQLSIKVIHIAEKDTQIANQPKKAGEFVNTWSIDGFISEGSQPAEMGWGSHEKQLPEDAAYHANGSGCAIYLNRPGASTRVRTWTPLAGPFHGFLITHGESISIADYLTLKENDALIYRPTVHYAYHPCEDAVLSLHELAGREWLQQENQRLLFDEIIEGRDELGVLLMGNKKGAYWFGSQLSIEEARNIAPLNNATSLQVAIGVVSGMMWVIENPRVGIVEPDEIDYQYILNISRPYLGKVIGSYTEWTPLKDRERLFAENIDYSDPWQFINLRVN